MSALPHMWGSRQFARTKSLSSPFTKLVPETELRSLGLVESALYLMSRLAGPYIAFKS